MSCTSTAVYYQHLSFHSCTSVSVNYSIVCVNSQVSPSCTSAFSCLTLRFATHPIGALQLLEVKQCVVCFLNPLADGSDWPFQVRWGPCLNNVPCQNLCHELKTGAWQRPEMRSDAPISRAEIFSNIQLREYKCGKVCGQLQAMHCAGNICGVYATMYVARLPYSVQGCNDVCAITRLQHCNNVHARVAGVRADPSCEVGWDGCWVQYLCTKNFSTSTRWGGMGSVLPR